MLTWFIFNFWLEELMENKGLRLDKQGTITKKSAQIINAESKAWQDKAKVFFAGFVILILVGGWVGCLIWQPTYHKDILLVIATLVGYLIGSKRDI